MVRHRSTSLENGLEIVQQSKLYNSSTLGLTSTSSEVVPSAKPLTSTTLPLELAPLIDIPFSPFASRRALSAGDKLIFGAFAALLSLALRDLLPSKRSCFQAQLMSPFGVRCGWLRVCFGRKGVKHFAPGRYIHMGRNADGKDFEGRRMARRWRTYGDVVPARLPFFRTGPTVLVLPGALIRSKREAISGVDRSGKEGVQRDGRSGRG